MNPMFRFMRGLRDAVEGDGEGGAGGGTAVAPTYEDLVAQRGAAFDAMDTIIRTAEEEGEEGTPRPLTDEERAEYASHRSTYERLDGEVAEAETARTSTEIRGAHELARNRARGPLFVGLAEEPAAATRSLDELLWASASEVTAGTYQRNGAFAANPFGARNPVEDVIVATRSGGFAPAPRIEDFAPQHAGRVRSFQRMVSDMALFGLLIGKRGEINNSQQAFVFARSHPLYAGRWEAMMRAMDVDTAGEGAEWVPTGIGASLHEKVRASGRVAPLFARINLPTNPWKWPLEGADATAYILGEPTSDTATKPTASTPGSAGATFDAEIFAARALFSRSLDADSAVAVLPFVTSKIAQAFADAEERAILDGDSDGTHQDSDTDTAGATDAAWAWDGLRKKALAQTLVSGGGDAIALADLRAGRALMGKWGLNPAELAIIIGVGPYYDLLADTNFATVDKFGPQAVVLNGQLGAADGIPVIVSEHVRENLNASGVHDGVTETLSYALIVNRGEFAIGTRENLDVEVDDSLYRETYQRLVVGFQREDFQHIGDAATNDDVSIVYNVT